LLKIIIKTGRTHQIRRHFAHLRHPVIGDTSYGDRHHNRLFREKFHCTRLLLHASQIEFIHPYSKKKINIEANFNDEFKRILDLLQIKL
jgi:tRNA pseudouridine65 synthase